MVSVSSAADELLIFFWVVVCLVGVVSGPGLVKNRGHGDDHGPPA